MSALLAIVGTLALCVALIIFCAEGDNDRDWREDWCVPECMAAHEQDGPCGDCPARRITRF